MFRDYPILDTILDSLPSEVGADVQRQVRSLMFDILLGHL
jgi:hypothetical protein